jgi:hypothetical protein
MARGAHFATDEMRRRRYGPPITGEQIKTNAPDHERGACDNKPSSVAPDGTRCERWLGRTRFVWTNGPAETITLLPLLAQKPPALAHQRDGVICQPLLPNLF